MRAEEVKAKSKEEQYMSLVPQKLLKCRNDKLSAVDGNLMY